MAGGFVAALKQHSKEVQTLEGDQAAEFLRLLNELRDQVRGRLYGMAPEASTFDAFRLRQVLAETESGILTLERKAQGQYSGITQDAADLAIEHTSSELERLGATFDTAPTVVSIDAAKVLADPVQRLLANHFQSSVKRYGLDVLNGVRQKLFVGMRTGDSFGDVVKSVTSDKGPLGELGRSNGERLVRTETSQAYGVAQHTSVLEAKKQIPSLKKIWLHISSFPCDVCMPLHGTMRDLDGTWTIRMGKKTREVAHPPGHPNCTCRVSAMKPSWKNKLQDLGYLDQDGPEAKPQDL